MHRLKSESTCLSKKKIAENAASRPNFGDFFGRRAPPPAPPAGFRRILRTLGGGRLVAAPQELVLENRDRRHGTSAAARSSSWLSSSSEPETEPLPPSQPIVSATYRVRARARRPRPEAAAYAPAAACRRRFPGARGARKFTFTAKDGRRSRAAAAEPGADTEAASCRAGGPAVGRSPHTMAFLGSRRQPVSGKSSRARLATVEAVKEAAAGPRRHCDGRDRSYARAGPRGRGVARNTASCHNPK